LMDAASIPAPTAGVARRAHETSAINIGRFICGPAKKESHI
jgi:hypothetical protein